MPRRITLDIDDTFDAVHGGQQLRLFNAHCDDYRFQPIVVFDGEGRFVTTVLRPAPKGSEYPCLSAPPGADDPRHLATGGEAVRGRAFIRTASTRSAASSAAG